MQVLASGPPSLKAAGGSGSQALAAAAAAVVAARAQGLAWAARSSRAFVQATYVYTPDGATCGWNPLRHHAMQLATGSDSSGRGASGLLVARPHPGYYNATMDAVGATRDLAAALAATKLAVVSGTYTLCSTLALV